MFPTAATAAAPTTTVSASQAAACGGAATASDRRRHNAPVAAAAAAGIGSVIAGSAPAGEPAASTDAAVVPANKAVGDSEQLLACHAAAHGGAGGGAGAQQGDATDDGNATPPQIPSDLVFISVPTAEHSRKPFLGPLLAQLGLLPGDNSQANALGYPPDPQEQLRGAATLSGQNPVPLLADATVTHSIITEALGCHHSPSPDRQRGGGGGTFQGAPSECIGHVPAPTAEQAGAASKQGVAGAGGALLPACLELFAREMHAGWVSAGDEVLRFQEAALFELGG
jgi:hypothetical protein